MQGRPRKLTDHDLLELHGEGLMGVEIADIMGCDPRTVYNRMKKLGLSNNPQHSRNAWVYRVCNPDTGEVLQVGTAREIEAKRYISTSTVYWYAKQTAAGKKCRYCVYRVVE